MNYDILIYPSALPFLFATIQEPRRYTVTKRLKTQFYSNSIQVY